MANKTINEIQDDIIEEFSFFGDDWMEKYEYIIDLDKKLPLISPELKDEKHLIRFSPGLWQLYICLTLSTSVREGRRDLRTSLGSMPCDE